MLLLLLLPGMNLQRGAVTLSNGVPPDPPQGAPFRALRPPHHRRCIPPRRQSTSSEHPSAPSSPRRWRPPRDALLHRTPPSTIEEVIVEGLVLTEELLAAGILAAFLHTLHLQ